MTKTKARIYFAGICLLCAFGGCSIGIQQQQKEDAPALSLYKLVGPKLQHGVAYDIVITPHTNTTSK
jgi:hypothetical protein